MIENKKSTALFGLIWSLVSQFGTLGLSFISNIILARLLSPSDFGCIGMLMVFVALANTFVDGGLGAALVQKKNPTETDFLTVFSFNVALSITIYIVLFISAPVVADFYRLEILSDILRVQGIILFINALRIVKYNNLMKMLKFKQLAVCELLSSALGCATGIVLAYRGAGVWSLVVNNIMYSIVFIISINFVDRTTKVGLKFNVHAFKSLFSFGGLILLSNLIDTASKNIQSLVIGRIFNISQLGFYSQAEKLQSIPVMGISKSINGVFFPVFSEIQDDKKRLCNALLKSTNMLTYFSFPIMAILILIAYPLIGLVYSERWLPSVPFFQVLCLAGMIIPVNLMNLNIIRSVGKGKIYLFMQTFQFIVGLLGVLIGSRWGINGLLMGSVVAIYLYFICILFINNRVIGLNFVEQIKNLSGNGFVTLIAFSITYYALLQFGDISLSRYTVLSISIFVLIYISVSALLKVKGFVNTINFIKDKQNEY